MGTFLNNDVVEIKAPVIKVKAEPVGRVSINCWTDVCDPNSWKPVGALNEVPNEPRSETEFEASI